MDPELRSRLLYRRQYFYGPRIEGFPDWNHFRLPNGSELAVHPDLECTHVEQGGRTLVLLGYMLDPDEPETENSQILQKLLAASLESQPLIKNLERIAGRYILMVFFENEQFVLTDAAGLRQVFYHQDGRGQLWLTAQPGLLQDLFDFHYSIEAEAFLQSPTITKSHEPWWPGNSTPFEEVRHLLPNHMLNLISAEEKRYWPREPLTRYSLEKSVEKATTLLRGIMQAANHRFDLAMALTGGYDSRIVFAACRDFVTDLHVYSMIYHKLTPDSSDIKVAQQLAAFTGVQHQLFRCDQPMDEDFTYLYSHNLEKSYQSYGNIVYGRFMNLDQKYVVVKSVVNEIVRCFYYRTGVYPYRIDADLLCRVSKLGDHEFVKRNFATWLEDAQPAAELGYKLLDLFYWENRNANWQAMSQLEFDLSHDEFTPFDNRELLVTMLGVDHKYRCMPENRLQHALVRKMWPELDQIPYNPTSKIIRKPFYEGPWMNAARWIKYHLITR